MVFQLHIPELTENEHRRLGQLHIEMLKRKKFKKCMVGKGCRGKIVQGHVVPHAWLKQIATADEVYVFSPYSPPKELVDWEDVYEPPVKNHANNALTRYFTCEEHEKLFFSIDKFDPDLSSLKNIHLVLYKSILAQIWLESFLLKCHRRLAEESPTDELYRALAQANAEHLQGLRYYKRETEKCLYPRRCKRCRGGPCKTIGHKKHRVQGKLGIASSAFSDGTRERRRIHPDYGRVFQPIANCGITVLPTERGHTTLIHYFKKESHIIQTELDHIAGLDGRKLEAYISAMVLSSCEDIAINPSFWEGLGRRRQEAIRKRFQEDMPDIGVGTSEMMDKWADELVKQDTIIRIPNPNQINLFR